MRIISRGTKRQIELSIGAILFSMILWAICGALFYGSCLMISGVEPTIEQAGIVGLVAALVLAAILCRKKH